MELLKFTFWAEVDAGILSFRLRQKPKILFNNAQQGISKVTRLILIYKQLHVLKVMVEVCSFT